MSGLDLDPIKERLAAATPGPLGFSTAPAEGSSESPAEYVANAFTGYGEMYVVWDTSTEGNPEGYVLTAVTGDGPRASANAELYAHAPSDLAALISEVERLREQVEAVRATPEDLKASPRSYVFHNKDDAQSLADLLNTQGDGE